MEGDPYCSHCGAHLSWNNNDSKHDQIDGGFNNYVRRPTGGNSDSEKIDEVLNSMHLFDAKKRLGLKRKLLEFYSARDCINLNCVVNNGDCIFAFTRSNGYVKTVDEFHYYMDDPFRKSIFEDAYSRNSYDGLYKNPKFKSSVESKGMEFLGCYGGYKIEYDMAKDEFRMIDEVEVQAYFRVNGKRRIFDLDLNTLTLSDTFSEID